MYTLNYREYLSIRYTTGSVGVYIHYREYWSIHTLHYRESPSITLQGVSVSVIVYTLQRESEYYTTGSVSECNSVYTTERVRVLHYRECQ